MILIVKGESVISTESAPTDATGWSLHYDRLDSAVAVNAIPFNPAARLLPPLITFICSS